MTGLAEPAGRMPRLCRRPPAWDSTTLCTRLQGARGAEGRCLLIRAGDFDIGDNGKD